MRVVLIDDMDELVVLAEAFLAPATLVARFATAEEAMAYRGWDDDIDVALLDWLMPGGGAALAEFLRREHPQVVRIVLSALYPAPRDLPRGLVHAWLDKTSISELPQLLDDALQN